MSYGTPGFGRIAREAFGLFFDLIAASPESAGNDGERSFDSFSDDQPPMSSGETRALDRPRRGPDMTRELLFDEYCLDTAADPWRHAVRGEAIYSPSLFDEAPPPTRRHTRGRDAAPVGETTASPGPVYDDSGGCERSVRFDRTRYRAYATSSRCSASRRESAAMVNVGAVAPIVTNVLAPAT